MPSTRGVFQKLGSMINSSIHPYEVINVMNMKWAREVIKSP